MYRTAERGIAEGDPSVGGGGKKTRPGTKTQNNRNIIFGGGGGASAKPGRNCKWGSIKERVTRKEKEKEMKDRKKKQEYSRVRRRVMGGEAGS